VTIGKIAMESTMLSNNFSVKLARRNPRALLSQPARKPEGNSRTPKARIASEMPLRSWRVNWESMDCSKEKSTQALRIQVTIYPTSKTKEALINVTSFNVMCVGETCSSLWMCADISSVLKMPTDSFGRIVGAE
jgi:hypothetical protein